MRLLLLLVLLVGGAGWLSGELRAQPAPPTAVVSDARGRCQLTYAPGVWQVRPAKSNQPATLHAGDTAAVVRLEVRPLPDDRRDFTLLREGRPDSVLHRIQALPLVEVLRLDQRAESGFDEIAYDYAYGGTAPGTRIHVVGRQRWRGGFAFRAEYRARASHDSAYLAAGRAVVASLAFGPKLWASRRYADQLCDGKMYGIAAQRFHNEQLEDDCRSINEFDPTDPSSPVTVHARVLPFQSYALAKGFDNCLYAVSKAPTDAPLRVYRYDPATREGEYTDFWLPAQGPENVWISAATDDRGDLYFLTSDANKLVKVSPSNAHVTVVWTSDPLHKAPFYPYIGFASAGTHANICLDDANTLYMVYSTDGSLFKIDLTNQQPFAEPVYLKGLPARGGYSDLLMQNDAQGRRRLYLAGPHALYQVDLAHREASRVRKGTYTDLAGCNLFRVVRPPDPAPLPPTPAEHTPDGREALAWRLATCHHEASNYGYHLRQLQQRAAPLRRRRALPGLLAALPPPEPLWPGIPAGRPTLPSWGEYISTTADLDLTRCGAMPQALLEARLAGLAAETAFLEARLATLPPPPPPPAPAAAP